MIISGTRIGGSRFIDGSTSTVVTDDYFNLVALLLPGNGTNGAQNNTFLDSSTNNFTVTRNGNPTQGTFSPFSQTGWSNYFDGSGDYISAPDNAALEFGSGDFTIEAWIYLTAYSASYSGFYAAFLVARDTSGARSYNFGVTGTASSFTGLSFYTFDGSGNANLAFSASATINLNTWYHVAVSRSSTTFRLFLDGTLIGTTTSAVSVLDTATPTRIGSGAYSGFEYYTAGYISNVRIVKGTAVYTSAFTPSTTPLTAISGTSLLTCQSNRFIDNSSNAFAITVSGNTSVQAFSPFDPTAAYSTSTVGGSGYFDGTGDYLTAPYSTQVDITQGDFTIEAWVYRNVTGAAHGIACQRPNSATNTGWGFRINSTNTLQFYYTGGSSVTTSATISAGAWTHVAATRSGATVYLFINGALSTSASFSNGSTAGSGVLTVVGAENDFSGSMNGYISNLRIVKGTAVYTAAFTPPTAPVTAITNTSVLLSCTNAGITDATAKNVLETVGSAQISTTQSKFGGSSMSFDGNGDGLFVPYSSILAFGTGNFTLEFWLRFNSISGYQTIISFGYVNQVANGWIIQTGLSDGKMNFYRTNASDVTLIAADNGSNSNINQWYHIAIVRKDTSNFYIYRDGNAVGTSSDSSNYNPSTLAKFYVGGGSNTGFNNYYLNGYIQDLRITRGYARYTANFTPPTTAFPTQ